MLDCLEMKYGLRCNVTSKIRLTKPESLSWDDLTVELRTNAEGYFAQISITASGLSDSDYRINVGEDHIGKARALMRDRDVQLHAKMMAAIHGVESFLAIYGNLEAIHSNLAETFVEAESDEEKARSRLNAWGMTPDIEDPIVDFSPEALRLILSHAKLCSRLTATIAFHRDGVNNIRRAEYISAFFGFYFVLEGLYGNGKSNSHHVIEHFKRSPELVSAVDRVVAQGIPEPIVFGDIGIPEMLGKMNKAQTTDNLIELLVQKRGALHHYAGTKSRTGASPLTNEHYFSLAQFFHASVENRVGKRAHENRSAVDFHGSFFGCSATVTHHHSRSSVQRALSLADGFSGMIDQLQRQKQQWTKRSRRCGRWRVCPLRLLQRPRPTTGDQQRNKARWAVKRAAEAGAPAKRKGGMTAADRKRLADPMRKRWAVKRAA
jgi:hypothetical protein